MMRRRFRRRSRARWTWCNESAFEVDPGSVNPFGTYYGNFAWILPPARVKFLLDTSRRRAMMFRGAHLWLDYHTRASGNVGLPDVIFYVCVQKTDEAGESTIYSNPWDAPAAPSTINTANWEPASFPSDLVSDGLDPFMWCHYMKGISPPNAGVTAFTVSTNPPLSGIGNQFNSVLANSDHLQLNCRTFSTREEWQPDVRIKTRRTLRGGDGIALVMLTPELPDSMTLHLDWKARVLTS